MEYMDKPAILTKNNISKHLCLLPDWYVSDNHLKFDYQFKNSKYALAFVLLVAMEAEAKNHHPICTFCYNKVSFALTTHSAGNQLTNKDFELANYINKNINKFI